MPRQLTTTECLNHPLGHVSTHTFPSPYHLELHSGAAPFVADRLILATGAQTAERLLELVKEGTSGLSFI